MSLRIKSLGNDTAYPETINAPGAAAFNGTVYVIGGSGMGTSTRPACSIVVDQQLKFGRNAWAHLPGLPTAMINPAVVAHNGKIYVLGGVQFSSNVFPSLNTLQCFDIAGNSWRHLAAMPFHGGGQTAATIIGNKIYILGGFQPMRSGHSGLTRSAAVEVGVYDIAANSWSTLPSLPTENSYSALAVGTKLFAFTQSHGPEYLIDTAIAGARWENFGPSFPTKSNRVDRGVTNYGVVAFRDYIVVVGGISNGRDCTGEIWILDTRSGAWTSGGGLRQPRGKMAVAVVSSNGPNAALYVVGGAVAPANKQPLDTVEVFMLVDTGPGLLLAEASSNAPATAPRLSSVPGGWTPNSFSVNAEQTTSLTSLPWINSATSVEHTSITVNTLTARVFSFLGDGSFQTKQLAVTGSEIVFTMSTYTRNLIGIVEVELAVSYDGQAWESQRLRVEDTSDEFHERTHTFQAPASARSFAARFIFHPSRPGPSLSLNLFSVAIKGGASQSGVRKYDEVCWICSHNSFCDFEDGWWHAQQTMNIKTQLRNKEVRALMLDLHEQNGDVFLIHSSFATVPKSGPYLSLREILIDIDAFLDDNPQEIVTLFFQNELPAASYPLVARAFAAAGNIQSKLFLFDRANQGASSSWTVADSGAPTLQWMRDNNKRCVVFSDSKSAGVPGRSKTGADGWPMVWYYCRESVYGGASLAPSTWAGERTDYSTPFRDVPRTIGLLNHFPSFSLPGGTWDSVGHYSEFNHAEKLTAQINAWKNQHNRLPNFLAVDFVEIGNLRGASAAVAFCERRWQHDSQDAPPDPKKLFQIGPTVAQIKEDMKGIFVHSVMAIAIRNMSVFSLKLVGCFMKHGRAPAQPPSGFAGLWDDGVVMNGDTGTECTCGVSTISGYGPEGFWLFEVLGTERYLFVGVSVPLALLFYNNYANAKLLVESDMIRRFKNSGDNGEEMFNSLYEEKNNIVTSADGSRLKATSWICDTWDMRDGNAGDMNVSVWNY